MAMRERGFTVAELLVGMAVGLLVLLAVTSVYLTVLRSSSTNLDASRLNQEMAAIMNIMVNDIRRAGYWGGAATAFNTPFINPFTAVETASSTVNISALRVHSNGGDPNATYSDVTYDANGKVADTSIGSCITYTYDADDDEILDNDEMFSFRWDGWQGRDSYDSSSQEGLLLMRTSSGTPNVCGEDTGGVWAPVNSFGYDGTLTGDGRFKSGVIITNLEFSITGSSCYNASEPDGVDNGGPAGDADVDPTEFDCYDISPTVGVPPGNGSGHSTIEVVTVVITLEAELADDPVVKATQVQSVTPRNNLIRRR